MKSLPTAAVQETILVLALVLRIAHSASADTISDVPKNTIEQSNNTSVHSPPKAKALSSLSGKMVQDDKNAMPSKAAMRLLKSGYKKQSPDFTMVRALKQSDKPFFIKEFKSRPFPEKVCFMWVLAFMGGADVRDVFQSVLENGDGSRTLDSDDVHILVSIGYSLGHVAGEDQKAYDFLLQHLRPENWAAKRKWKIAPKQNDWHVNCRLAGSMIKAIAYSGREDARAVLQEVPRWEKETLFRVSGSFVDAQCILDTSKNRDRQESVEKHAIQSQKNFDEWAKTENGVRWEKWLYDIHKNYNK